MWNQNLKQHIYLQIHESKSSIEIFMSLPHVALFSGSIYAALHVGVLWEGTQKDFTRTITLKICNAGCGCLLYCRNFLLWHLYSVEVFIVRKSWKALMTIRTNNGWSVSLSLQLVWFQDCRNTKDKLNFFLPIIFACFLGFSVCPCPCPPMPAVSHNCITGSFVLPQILDLSSFLACVPVNDIVDYPAVLYSKAVVWLIFPLVAMLV